MCILVYFGDTKGGEDTKGQGRVQLFNCILYKQRRELLVSQRSTAKRNSGEHLPYVTDATNTLDRKYGTKQSDVPRGCTEMPEVN